MLNIRNHYITTIIISLFSILSGSAIANQAKSLDLVPQLKEGVEIKKSDGLSTKNKRILNQIYQNEKKRNEKYKKQQKYNIDHSANNNNVEGYDTIQGDGKFDIQIRKPGKKLEKKHELYKKSYNAMIDSQYEVAIFYYEAILKKYYKDEYALVGLALAYHYLGDITSASKFYAKAISLYPNNLTAINNFIILVGRESPQEALTELLRIDQISNNNHVLKAQIGYLYAKQREYDNAIKYIDMALGLSNQNVVYLYNKAVILDRIGVYREAQKLYSKVLNNRSVNQLGISAEKIKNRLNEINNTKN